MSVPALRHLAKSDLRQAAALHAVALHAGLFPLLGERFLVRYLDTFRASPHAVAFAAELDGRFVGFLVGTTGGHSEWVLRHRWRQLLPAGLLGLAAHPDALLLLVQTRLPRYGKAVLRVLRGGRGQRGGGAERTSRTEVPAVLMHVAVAPGARGRGVAGALVAAFEEAAVQRGSVVARLVTGDQDGPAARLYRGRGWTLVGQSGREAMWLYEKRLAA